MALKSDDESDVRKIVKKELKDFLNSTDAQNSVIKIIQRELGTKKIDEKIVDLATKVVVELFKTLWQRKSFWEGSIKNVK